MLKRGSKKKVLSIKDDTPKDMILLYKFKKDQQLKPHFFDNDNIKIEDVLNNKKLNGFSKDSIAIEIYIYDCFITEMNIKNVATECPIFNILLNKSGCNPLKYTKIQEQLETTKINTEDDFYLYKELIYILKTCNKMFKCTWVEYTDSQMKINVPITSDTLRDHDLESLISKMIQYILSFGCVVYTKKFDYSITIISETVYYNNDSNLTLDKNTASDIESTDVITSYFRLKIIISV